MNEISQSESSNPTIESRIQGLNQILSGVRSHLEQGQSDRRQTIEKVDSLEGSLASLSDKSEESFAAQRTILDQWQERITYLESWKKEQSELSESKEGNDEIEVKLATLNQTLQVLRDRLEEQDQNTEDTPSFDQEAFDKKIESVQEHYGVIENHMLQMEEKQNQQFLRIQQLEISKEELLAKTREIWSMGNEFKGSLQDQEGRLDVFEKDRCDIKEKVSDLELELATKFGPGHEAWTQAMSQLGELQQKLEDLQQDVGMNVSKTFEETQTNKKEIEELNSGKNAIEEKLGQFEDVNKEIDSLKEQSSRFEEHVQSSQLGHEILLDGMKVEIGSLNTKVEDFKKQFETEVENKSKFLNKELVLARDSQYDQHQKVQKELDQVKQQQREIGNLKETVDEKEKETKVLKQEIRVLKNEMGALYRQLNHQRRMAVGAIAAAVFMSVGLSYILSPMPTESDFSSAPLAMETSVQQFGEATLDLDAPQVEVEEVYLKQNDVETVSSTDFYNDEVQATQPIQEEAPKPMVAPAFTKEEPASEPVKPSFVDYTVRDGDSLWAIAKKHKGTGRLMERIEKIKRDNQLKNPDIKKGQVLRIFL